MARLLMELEAITSTLAPSVDITKLKLRFEEVGSNYNVGRKTTEEMENDFEEKVNLYINSLKLEGYSEQTMYGNRNDLMALGRFVDKAVAQVTTPDIRSFLAHKDTWTNSTIAKKLSTIKTFYRWLVSEELLLRSVAERIKTPRQEKRLPKAMTVVDLEKIRDVCKTTRERALVEVFYSTGCRLSELAGMKTESINWANGSLPVIGKGNKERIVYLNSKAIFQLEKYLEERKIEEDDCEYLFSTNIRPYKKMSNNAIQRAIKKIASRVETSTQVTCHTFRRTTATLAIENGIELGDLQQILGHSSPSTTVRYIMVSEERKRNAHKKYIQ